MKKVNVVTVTPEMVDPVFFYLLIDSSVNYDPVVLLTDSVNLQTNINSTLMCPSKVPVMTILEPENVAICIRNIFNLIN